jgi:hypothetical protein
MYYRKVSRFLGIFDPCPTTFDVYAHVSIGGIVVVIIIIIIMTTLQPFVGLWLLCQILDPIHSR